MAPRGGSGAAAVRAAVLSLVHTVQKLSASTRICSAATRNAVRCLERNCLLTQVSDWFTIGCHDSLWCGPAPELHTWETVVQCDSDSSPSSPLSPPPPHLSFTSILSWDSSFHCFPHAAARREWLSLVFCVFLLRITSCLSSNKHHACSSSSLSSASSWSSFSSSSRRTNSFCRPMGKTVQCAMLCHKSNMFCCQTCRLSLVLCVLSCHELSPPRFAPLPPEYLCAFQLVPFQAPQLPLPVPLWTTCDLHDSLVSSSSRTSAVILGVRSDLLTRVDFLLSGC